MYVVQRRTGRRRHAQAPREGLLQLRRGALEAGAESLHLRQPTERACAQGFLHSASFRAQSCRGAGAQRPARGATHREADSCVRRTHSPTAPAPPPPRRLRVSPLSQAQSSQHTSAACASALVSRRIKETLFGHSFLGPERRALQLTKLILFSYSHSARDGAHARAHAHMVMTPQFPQTATPHERTGDSPHYTRG